MPQLGNVNIPVTVLNVFSTQTRDLDFTRVVSLVLKYAAATVPKKLNPSQNKTKTIKKKEVYCLRWLNSVFVINAK